MKIILKILYNFFLNASSLLIKMAILILTFTQVFIYHLVQVIDNALVSDIGVQTLTMLGYTVLAASNGTEALSLVEKYDGRIDLLITGLRPRDPHRPARYCRVQRSHRQLAAGRRFRA